MTNRTFQEAELEAMERKAGLFSRLSKLLMAAGLLIPVLYWIIDLLRRKDYYMEMGSLHPMKEAMTESSIYLFLGFGICTVVLLLPAAVIGSAAERWRNQVKDARKAQRGGKDQTIEEIYQFETASNLKPAILIALILHLMLLWTVFPQFGRTEKMITQENRIVIKRWRPTPPKRKEFQKKKEKREKKEKLVPIPDPTPDEPEPIKEIDEEDTFDDIPVADDFFVDEPDEPPGPMIVGGDVKKPIAKSKVNPEYTDIAKALRIEGTVILRAVISKNGDVQSVEVLKGLGYGLDEKAQDALRQWKFQPGTLNGRPVDVIFTLTIIFKLTGM